MKRKFVALSMVVAMAITVFLSPVHASAGQDTFKGSVAEDDKDAASAGTVENSKGDNNVEIGTTVNLNHYGDAIIYSVAVEWGTMEFTYDYGAVWNPVTHKYDTSASKLTKGGWLPTDYKPANNAIKITNNSNYPITANLEYVRGFDTIGDITGVFSLTESAEAFKTAYDNGVSPITEMSVDLDICTTYLAGTTAYWGLSTPSNYTKSVYFAYQGTPEKLDTDGKTPASDGTYSVKYTDVGSIRVTIQPCDAGSVSQYSP